jgi:hypothetical protein
MAAGWPLPLSAELPPKLTVNLTQADFKGETKSSNFYSFNKSKIASPIFLPLVAMSTVSRASYFPSML